MTVTDEFIEANRSHQETFTGPLPLPSARNAGGVVTEDALRSLAISQRLLAREEIVLLHHTDCGMETFTDDGFRQDIESETGIRPTWAAEAFPEAAADVRQGINRIRSNPFVARTDKVRGFVFDVATGAIDEVQSA